MKINVGHNPRSCVFLFSQCWDECCSDGSESEWAEEGTEWGGGQARHRYKVSYGQTPHVKMGQKLPARDGTQRKS